ncbi:DinB family protein [Longimicrobium sp.]|uniref:DinB family protein n=1 Tax=Longimicrobium sp. TaxID=2029185 RepID=UPI002CB32E26|nr:DinB family protein [Longimicrobium sp.]HSU14707.1 DinB family protein [Longimicrobium sp.]
MAVATVSKQPAVPAERDDPRWDEAVDEHRAALAAFLNAAEAATDEAWSAPWAPGKWTRAQIAEHLALAYEAALHEIRTGEAMRPRLPPWRQKLLRWVLLPHILFHRTFPLRAVSPREIRPPEATRPRREQLRRLRELGERFEVELDVARRGGGGGISHPYFGRVGPVKGMRFVAVHIEHHTRQIAKGE